MSSRKLCRCCMLSTSSNVSIKAPSFVTVNWVNSRLLSDSFYDNQVPVHMIWEARCWGSVFIVWCWLVGWLAVCRARSVVSSRAQQIASKQFLMVSCDLIAVQMCSGSTLTVWLPNRRFVIAQPSWTPLEPCLLFHPYILKNFVVLVSSPTSGAPWSLVLSWPAQRPVVFHLAAAHW